MKQHPQNTHDKLAPAAQPLGARRTNFAPVTTPFSRPLNPPQNNADEEQNSTGGRGTLHFIVPSPKERKRIARRLRGGILVRSEQIVTEIWQRCRSILTGQRGAVTAEYAIVIMAAVAFAGVLLFVMRSPEVRQALTSVVQNALTAQ